MATLNDIYSEKKVEVDPLDKLFYQYNFSSGNNMRANTNATPIQINYNPMNNQQSFNAYKQQQQQNNVYNNNQQGMYRINSNY